MNDTLSIIPYYGGKSHMAKFIADNLNYDSSQLYIEPFGGACRVLLNKPPHAEEIYSDYGDGISTIIKMLADKNTAQDFIYELAKTEYSEQEFLKQQEIYDECENGVLSGTSDRLTRCYKKLFIRYNMLKESAHNYQAEELMCNEKILDQLFSYIKKEPTDEKNKILREIIKYSSFYQAANKVNKEYDYFERFRDFFHKQHVTQKSEIITQPFYSDMELAVATYVVFMQSRDAMGKTWSASKFKSTEAYRKQMERLFECAERLKSVEIKPELVADQFISSFTIENGEISKRMSDCIKDSQVMMYCDPSYIDPIQEEKLLTRYNINVNTVSNVNEAIKQRAGKQLPKNLGSIYAMSFNYEDQEEFLNSICDAQCKIMVSNYNLQLYNKYLNENTGWRKLYFETTTGVGGRKDNKRLEVLWYNY